MVGGGTGSFIGEVHRMAMRLDNQIELTAGAFSTNPAKSRAFGAELLLPSDRIYDSYVEMIESEAMLPEAERIDFVVIVTPNATHVPIARAFLEAGFHVVCDKPLATSLKDALELREIVQASGKLFVLTHNYTGYVMVKEARAIVLSGRLGKLRKVVVEYPQAWMSHPLPNEGRPKGPWRADPAQNGPSGCLADIGTHAENLARYISGLHIAELCAEFTSFVPHRRLEDDASLLLRYGSGAKGILSASQISIGHDNSLTIRIYGEEAALTWRQEQPNELRMAGINSPEQILSPGHDYLSEEARRFTRLPSGHPEGFIEAFANIYREATRAMRGDTPAVECDFPTVDDGVEGMAFLECAGQSARAGGEWARMPKL